MEKTLPPRRKSVFAWAFSFAPSSSSLEKAVMKPRRLGGPASGGNLLRAGGPVPEVFPSRAVVKKIR